MHSVNNTHSPKTGPEAQPSTTAPEPAATAPQVTPSQLPTTLGQSLILNPVAPGPNYYPGVVQRGNSCKGASMITLTGFSGGFEQYTVKSNYRDPQNPTLKAPEVSFKMPARKWAKSGPASQTAPPTASNSKPKAEANDAGKKGTPKEKAPSETATKLPSARPNSQADSQTEMSQGKVKTQLASTGYADTRPTDLGYDTEEDEPARGRSPVRQEDAAVTAAASTSTASTTANVPAPRADSCDPEAP